jgi:hypothetical protein
MSDTLPAPIGGTVSIFLPSNEDEKSNVLILAEALSSAATYAQAEKAEATRRAYRSDFADFRTWCEARCRHRRRRSPPMSPCSRTEASRPRPSRGGSPRSVMRID